MAKAIVDTRELSADRRFKSWSKTLTGVDTTKADGYAFRGEFIKDGLNELALGTYILHYHEEGSAKYHDPHVELYRVTGEGLECVESFGELARQWALEIRDRVAAIVNAPQAGPSADEIAAAIALLQAAGYTVTKPEA